MKYHIEIIASAIKSLKKIDSQYIKKICERINLLRTDPRHEGSIKIVGKKDTYRTRVGKYHIIYEIYDQKVLVIILNIDHRKDVYRS